MAKFTHNNDHRSPVIGPSPNFSFRRRRHRRTCVIFVDKDELRVTDGAHKFGIVCVRVGRSRERRVQFVLTSGIACGFCSAVVVVVVVVVVAVVV